MRKKNKSEVYPLLTTDWLGNPTYRQKPIARNIRQEDEESEPEMEDDEEIFDIIDNKKKRNVNMVWADVFLIAFDFLQILALMQSMSLRWVWPKKWLQNAYFIFGFNADVWEISKFTSSDTYKSVQDYYTPSSTVHSSWQMINYAWLVGIGLLAIVYAALHLSMKMLFYPLPGARRFMSRIQYVYVIVIHILTLPLGIVLFRNFQCESDWNNMYTINEFKCFDTTHWLFLGPSLILMMVVFMVYPIFLVWKIRQEAMTGTADGYLSHLLLKETEYKIHVNWSWLYDSMWLFSSFKHRGCYYRPMIQVFKLLLLIIFTGFFHFIELQAIMMTVLCCLVFIGFCIIRPFRLTSCNIFLLYGILCHLGTAFLSTMLTHYDVYSVPNAWLTPEYSIWFIVFIQASWGASLIALLVYLLTRTLCHSTKSCYKRPVWPNIVTSGKGQLTAETRKFMIAIIKAKISYEKIIRTPAMFAPVHELARHIQIINTYWREAEYTKDALHMVLWEVLDDLVEKHAELSTKSLFADSVKKSIRRTAGEFMQLVPMFSQRLAQRDYDFILMKPEKKRLLLKMFILGMFLNGRKEKVAKKKLLDPAVNNVWPPLPADREFEEEDGYYEDLYPGPLQTDFTDDLLDVVVDNSTDAESTEEEDNVGMMLKTLPHVDLVDLENPLVEELSDGEEEEPGIPRPTLTLPYKQPVGKSGAEPSMTKPTTAISKVSSSSSSSSSGHPAPSASQSSLFGSHASLRQDMGSMASMRQTLSPLSTRPMSGLTSRPASGQTSRPASGHTSRPASGHSSRPGSAGSVQSRRSLSPHAQAMSPLSRETSNASILSGKASQHSGQRSPMGGSVISLTPTRPDSPGSAVSDQEMANINPGYIPDTEEQEARGAEGGEEQTRGDNPSYEPDDEESVHVEDERKQEEKKKKKKSGSRRNSKSSHASSAARPKKKK